MNFSFRIRYILFTMYIAALMAAQPAPVTWNYKLIQGDMPEVVLHIDAQIAPGWHIYSLNIQPGGPLPTRFVFDQDRGYSLAGKMNEAGNAIRYYDKLYEMEITWYAEKVSYTQRLAVNQPASSITGRVNYMVCNEHVCIPVEKKFSINAEGIYKK